MFKAWNNWVEKMSSEIRMNLQLPMWKRGSERGKEIFWIQWQFVRINHNSLIFIFMRIKDKTLAGSRTQKEAGIHSVNTWRFVSQHQSLMRSRINTLPRTGSRNRSRRRRRRSSLYWNSCISTPTNQTTSSKNIKLSKPANVCNMKRKDEKSYLS